MAKCQQDVSANNEPIKYQVTTNDPPQVRDTRGKPCEQISEVAFVEILIGGKSDASNITNHGVKLTDAFCVDGRSNETSDVTLKLPLSSLKHFRSSQLLNLRRKHFLKLS